MEKKKITIIISIAIVLIMLITVGIITINLLNKKKTTKIVPRTELNKFVTELGIQDKNFEYGTTLNLDELKIPNNVKVLINGEEVSNTYTFKNLGKTPITLEKINTNGEKERETITVNIIDTKSPEIIGAEDKTVKQGENIDLKENIKVKDNTDELIDVSVVGKVNTNIPGDYEITYIAMDQSNNSSEKKIKIKVEDNPNLESQNNDNNNTKTTNDNNTQKAVIAPPKPNNKSNSQIVQKIAEKQKEQIQLQSKPQPVQQAKSQPNSQPTNKPIIITPEAFEREVLKSNKKVLVDIYTNWCGYCKMISPIIDEIAKENPNIKVVKVNATKDNSLNNKYQIFGYPTLMIFQKGKLIRKVDGYIGKSAIQSIIR